MTQRIAGVTEAVSTTAWRDALCDRGGAAMDGAVIEVAKAGNMTPEALLAASANRCLSRIF